MKIAVKIFFIILSVVMFFWLLKIGIVGAEVLGVENVWHIPLMYFFCLLCWYIWEKNKTIEGLEYEIEYLKEVIKETK